MTSKFSIEFTAKTDTGLVRSQNEDAILLSPAYGFAILADGMGGYNAGEVASSIAVAVVKEALEEGLRSFQDDGAIWRKQRNGQVSELMNNAIQRANSAVLAAANDEPKYNGMGTTLVAAAFHGQKLTIAHVGDSRAYRFRRGELMQITRDHSLLQEQIDAGLISAEWAHHAHNKNFVTRAVGVASAMEVETHDHAVEAGDIYLLCSDGLSDMLSSQEISSMLMAQHANLDVTCDTLIQAANDNGGYDNVSVVLARTDLADRKSGNFLDRIFGWVAPGRTS